MREYCDIVSEVSSNCLKQMKGVTNGSRYSGQISGVQVTLYPMLFMKQRNISREESFRLPFIRSLD